MLEVPSARCVDGGVALSLERPYFVRVVECVVARALEAKRTSAAIFRIVVQRDEVRRWGRRNIPRPLRTRAQPRKCGSGRSRSCRTRTVVNFTAISIGVVRL